MSVAGLTVHAMQNLADTYAALGREVPGARLQEGATYRACTGDLAHGICNFAVVTDANPETLSLLAAQGRGRTTFNIYLTGEDAAVYESHLADLNLARAFQLVQMVADGGLGVAFPELRPAAAELETASFMIGEFFPGLTGSTKLAVVEATARASGLNLREVRDENGLVAAAMTSESAGMMSLYNLCVATNHQNRGFGTAIVGAIKSEARSRGIPLGLQCDPRLENWYSGLGFRAIGTVDAYVLSNLPRGVIMN